MKELSQVKFREVMNPVAYLLPPRQRSIARFMNLSKVVDWSEKILMKFNELTVHEKKTFLLFPGSHSKKVIDVNMECTLLQNALQSTTGTYLRSGKSRSEDELSSTGSGANEENVQVKNIA